MSPPFELGCKTSARDFWQALTPAEKDELGCQLVLGRFNWMDWFTAPPPPGFMNKVEYERLYDPDGPR